MSSVTIPAQKPAKPGEEEVVLLSLPKERHQHTTSLPLWTLLSPPFSYFRVYHQCITLIKGQGTPTLWTLPCSFWRLHHLSSCTNAQTSPLLEPPVQHSATFTILSDSLITLQAPPLFLSGVQKVVGSDWLWQEAVTDGCKKVIID